MIINDHFLKGCIAVKKLLSILLTVLLLAFAVPVLANGGNVVQNGDFEKVSDYDRLPQGWSFHSYEAEQNANYGNASAFSEADDVRGGIVLHISVISNDDAAVYQTVAVEPNTIYRLSCYIKTQNVFDGAGANIALRGQIIALSNSVYGDSDWTLATLTGKTGPDQTTLVVSCRVGGYSAVSHGDAWFDDFSVEKLDSYDGALVPFFEGVIQDDEPEQNRGGWVIPALLVSLALIGGALALYFILKNRAKEENKPLPPVGSYAQDKERRLTGMELVRGRSFFDTRGNEFPEPTDTKLHFTKRDRIYVLLLTVVYGIIALLRLGTLNFPTSYWSANTGDSVRIEFGRSVKLSDVWQNTGISHTNYKLVTDNGEEIAFSNPSEYGHMFRWASINKGETASASATTGVTLVVLGGDSSRPKEADLVMLEMAFFDENGELVECTVDERAAALFDEQKTVPAYTSYMNGMYFDELYHGRTALEHINNNNVYEWTHPPLGKLIIAIGILIFGMKPFGWRIMGTLFGVAMVPIMYCLAKKVLKRSNLALFSTFLFTFDFMHFTQTRIATIDVYGVFFIMLMTYFMFDFISMDIGDSLGKMMRSLALSGLFFGLGCASKWIDIYTGAALALLFFTKLVVMGIKSYRLNRRKEYADRGLVKKFWSRTGALCCWCVLFFIVVPLIIYCASYFRYYSSQWKPQRQSQIYMQNYEAYESVDDVKLSLPDAVDTYVKGVIKNQKDMYNYHSGLDSEHSASSPWWTWLFDLRPTWFYVGGYGNPHGFVGTISSFGNPAVWTLCSLATIALVFVLIIHRRKFPLEAWFVFVCLGSSLLPWVLVSRSTYAYHFFASVPFITLAAGLLIGYWEDVSAYKRSQEGRGPGFVPWIKYIWMTVAGVLFVLFYPVISGLEVPYEYIYALQWVPFHKWEYRDAEGNLLKTVRIGWRFLDYEPSGAHATIIQK